MQATYLAQPSIAPEGGRSIYCAFTFGPNKTMQITALEKQLNFLREIDRLKNVIRQSPLLDKSRKENAAEHSWHLAMYALLLNEYAGGPVNTNRVIQMLLLHDVVEIDVGDHPIHGGSSIALQAEQESRAAERLFGLLPEPQGNDLLALWQEFERAETEDAKFAKALDRFQPLLINVFTGGGTWTENSVSLEQVFSRYGPAIKKGAPLLWNVCEQWVIQHFAGQASGMPEAPVEEPGIEPGPSPAPAPSASDNQPQLWVEPVGTIVLARLRGRCDENVLKECQDRVLALLKDTQQVKVLYDALELEEPTVGLALLQQKMDLDAWKQLGPVQLRRAILVPNTRVAYLARIAFGQFGEGGYRVFYNDMAQAILWLEEKM